MKNTIHNYYRSSIQQINVDVTEALNAYQDLIWLSRAEVAELTAANCLIGHEGLADGRSHLES